MIRLVSLFLLGVIAWSPSVHAQATETSTNGEEPRVENPGAAARQLFEEANTLFADGRFAEARDILRRALRLHPQSAIAFNLAAALRGTGEVLEAVGLLERIMAGDFGPFSAGERARDFLDATRAELGRLTVTVCGAESSTLRVDGTRVATLTDCETRTLPVDPGRHVLLFEADNAEVVERHLDIARGAADSMHVQLVVRPLFEPPPERRSIVRSPWFWVAAGVVLAGAGTALGLALRKEPLVTEGGRVIMALEP